MTLLQKFDSVQLSDEDMIPKDDKEWCEKEEANFKLVLAQLDEDEKQFRDEFAIEEKIDQCHYLVEGHYLGTSAGKYWKNRKDHQSSSNTEKPFYDLFRFSSAYAIETIVKLRKTCKAAFIENVTLYFVEKYNLDVPEFHKIKEKREEYCDYRLILKAIKEHLGGFLDFKGSAVEQAIIEIKQQLEYQTVTQDGVMIEMKRLFYMNRGGPYTYPAQHDRYTIKTWEALDKAISIFETEEVKSDYAIMYLCGKDCAEWDNVLNGEKIEGIKLYKNGKFQIKFKEPVFATQFMQRFNFKTS